jgi:hypothetical protein
MSFTTGVKWRGPMLMSRHILLPSAPALHITGATFTFTVPNSTRKTFSPRRQKNPLVPERSHSTWGGVSTRSLGPTMTVRGQSIGISIGTLDKLIRTTLGLKRGAPQEGAWGGHPTCHPQTPSVQHLFILKCLVSYAGWNKNSRTRKCHTRCFR